ncbi:MAG: helix-turn-helix domain-containing protein [Thermoflavifilum sp.]|nr:helix-turn-helix domain-containing protein [Thermoflavifilum sp.]MCL6515159.1 helix-turn-helix domain-containing protein [Alicyclobacillus sp.]
MTKIGRKLREVRVRRGLTQAQLAEGIVSSSMISQIEAGKTNPSFGILVQLANRLTTPVEYFLNDLDEPYVNATKLRLAEFYLVLHEPERALAYLEPLRPDNPFDPAAVRAHETQVGVNAWHVLLLVARAYRMKRRSDQAERLIEIVREHLLVEQNRYFEMLMLRESGQIEYDINNLEGAIHEWEKAVECGESLLTTREQAPFDVHRVLVDVLLSIGRAYRKKGEVERAQPYLERALEMAAPIATLRGAASSLLHHAQALLEEGEAAEAKLCLERGIGLMEAAQGIATAAYVARLANPSGDASEWDLAAEALISAKPDTFLESQVIALEENLDAADVETCLKLAAPLPALLQACCADETIPAERLHWLEVRLAIAEVGLDLKMGHAEEALARAEDLLAQLQATSDRPLRIRLLRRILEWHLVQGNQAEAQEAAVLLAQAAMGPQRAGIV